MTFLQLLPPDGAARDAVILGAIHTGNLNPVTWVTITMGRVQLRVSADYLGIEDEHVPMSEHVAQAAVDSLGAILPTPAIVDAIEAAATIVPLPTWTPPAGQSRSAQTSSEIFALCETNTRLLFGARGIQPGQLVAGHRKDVVLSRYMPDGVVCIYGARWPDGRRLQPLYPIPGGNPGHEHEYEDYSHGVRAVLNACLLDGQPALVSDILAGPLASLLGGPVARLRYPLPSTPATDRPSAPAGRPTDPAPAPRPTSKVLRMGDSGARVLELQQLLTAAGVRTDEDGIFGRETRASVVAFQRREGLDADGLAGEKTMGALHRYRDEQGDTLPDVVAIPFKQARNYRVGRVRRIRCVVLHTMEAAEVPLTAENVASWFAGVSAPMASAHFCVDGNSTVQCVREEDTAFAAPGLNADGLQIEMAGYASQGEDGWNDVYSRGMLAQAARLTADLCRRHSLPIAFVDAAGLLRGESGVTTHAEVTKAYRQSTHTDPGKNFPMTAFLELVRAA